MEEVSTTHLFDLLGVKLLPPPRVSFDFLCIELPLSEESYLHRYCKLCPAEYNVSCKVILVKSSLLTKILRK